MIIPIRCMNCGNCLADIWRYYQQRVKEIQGQTNAGSNVIYMDTSKVPETPTPQKVVLDELGLNRYCCRKHLLTHVDLIDKI
jgi:DNA-directed RNA polymerase subunit N